MILHDETTIRLIAHNFYLHRNGSDGDSVSDWQKAEQVYNQAVQDGAAYVKVPSADGQFVTIYIHYPPPQNDPPSEAAD
jgi:hypothetical protein